MSGNPDPKILEAAERLRKREAELNRREGILDQREGILWEREKAFAPPPPNWPGAPWPFRKLLYQNIPEEIPTESLQKLVTHAYLAWKWGLTFCLVWNLINQAAQVALEGKFVADLIVAIIYLIFYPWLAFVFFRLLYRAARKGKAALYILWFIVVWLQIVVYAIWALGIPGSGAGGIINAIYAFERNLAIGALIFVGFCLWVLLGLVHLYLFIRGRWEYRLVGGLAAAKNEAKGFAVETVKNNPDLVAAAAKQGAKAAMENPELVMRGAQAAARN
eukprot:TRINITY_DN1844_c0_g1_i2.p2 TRINITY_DN1844_c0_g1~~TRINITY_DN1844_c0_g1_i2.p2  ORF type:complete len:276 (+),score=81.03 TRINITY_DN1844_c0_g1_i2:102-929(+)